MADQGTTNIDNASTGDKDASSTGTVSTEFNAEVKFEELSQQVKSELGRAQKTQQSVDGLVTGFGELKEMLQTKTPTDPPDEKYISTEQDVLGVMDARDAKQAKATSDYNASYRNSINKLAMNEELSDDEVTRFEELTKTSFNSSRTNFADSSLDAESNFDKVMRVIEKERAGKGTVNLKGDDPKGTGVETSNNQDDKEPVMPNLDEHAQAYVDKMGYDAKKVTDVLKGPAPGGMKRSGL